MHYRLKFQMFYPILLPFFVLSTIFLVPKAEGKEHNHGLHRLRKCLETKGAAQKLIERQAHPSYYTKLNRQWNLRIQNIFPLAYFLPSRTLDVQHLVRCGTEARVRLIPNSGSHCYESVSFGSNKTVVIDFRRMGRIEVSENWLGPRTVSIQPGALVGQINARLHEEGRFGIPMGRCHLVGLGGHALGGGAGFYAPLYGNTLDSVLEVEMVDAGGRAVRANEDLQPELFWALRGVGPGLIGIVTQFKMKVFETQDLRVTFVTFNYPAVQFGRVAGALEVWQAYTARSMPYVRSGMYVTSDDYEPAIPPGPKGSQAYAIHYWDPVTQPERNITFLRKVRQYFPSDGAMEIQYLSHLEFLALIGYAAVDFTQYRNGTFQAPSNKILRKVKRSTETESRILAYLKRMRKGIEIPLYVKIRSFYIKKPLRESQMGDLVELLGSIPNYVLIQFEGLTGASQAVPVSATAYIHRRDTFYFSVQYEGPGEPGAVRLGMSWLEKFWKAAQFLDGGESYQGTPDLDDKNFLIRYFGRSLPRILAVKETWDPNNYFRSPLSLPVYDRRSQNA